MGDLLSDEERALATVTLGIVTVGTGEYGRLRPGLSLPDCSWSQSRAAPFAEATHSIVSLARVPPNAGSKAHISPPRGFRARSRNPPIAGR